MDIKGTEEPAQASDPSDGLIDFSGYFDGRFSIRDGFRGWLSAMRIRSPVYGSGSLKIGDTGLVIDGYVKVAGRVPSLEEVKKLILAAKAA